MIVPDINLLLYAYDAGSPFHSKAAAWWQRSLSGTEPVGLAQVAVFGFVRIGTNPRVFGNPLTPIEAAEHVRSGAGGHRGQRAAPSAAADDRKSKVERPVEQQRSPRAAVTLPLRGRDAR